MVRYFLCSNEQPLQFTAEVMRNFWPHMIRFVCRSWSSKKGHRWDGSSRHMLHEK